VGAEATATRVAQPRSPWGSLALCAVTVGLAGWAFGLAFPTRTDYLGHFAAGAGGTLLLLAPMLALTGARSWWRVVAVGVGLLGGVGTEATVFKIAIFDPVDLANQSLGAVLVGAALLEARRSWPAAAGAVALGLVMVAAGFHYAFA
jgi:hypothetical protein